MVVERTACYQRIFLVFGERPVYPICQRLVLVEALCYGMLGVVPTKTFWAEAHDLESVMHARYQKVVFTFFGRMPLDSPSSAAYVGLHEWDEEFAFVEQSDCIIVTKGPK